MPWANFDDKFPKHPKIVRLSNPAFRLYVSGICYCAEHLTDGLIDADMIPMLMPGYRPRYLAELVERAAWVRHGQVYEVHDYLQWNRSKKEVVEERERLREQRSAAGKKGAEARWHKE